MSRSLGIELPLLRHWEGSWAIIHTESGDCVLELMKPDARHARRMNGRAFHAITIGEHLSGLNSK